MWDWWQHPSAARELLKRLPVEFVAVTQDPGHQTEQRVWWERDPDRGDPFRRWGRRLPPDLYRLLAGATEATRFYCPSEAVARSVLSQVLLNHFREQIDLPPLAWGQDPGQGSPDLKRRRKQRRLAGAASYYGG